MRRLTVVAINRAIRARGLSAVLQNEGRGYYVLKAAGEEGGELHRYKTVGRVNRFNLESWVELAEMAVTWAKMVEEAKAKKRVEDRREQGLNTPRIDAHAPDMRFENDGPLGDAKHVKMQFVHVDGHRDWVTIANGPDLKKRFLRKLHDFFGVQWRLSRVAPVPVEEGYRLPQAAPEVEPNVSLEDAIALAHLVAEDLAEGRLKEEKVRIVQELVGGRVRQAAGSYKYVLLVGRWAIKVDKRKKPGDMFYIGAAGEALLIQSIKEKHAEIAKHFPITAVVNYYTAVQERADIDQTLYSRKKDLITKIAHQANIGDFHGANVGFRPGDDTPIFIDVAGSNNVHAQEHHHLNERFMTEYELDKAKKELADREREIAQHRTLIAELSTKLTQLNVGA